MRRIRRRARVAERNEPDARVARMLANYHEVIERFADGDMSADDFETEYLARFKRDPGQVAGPELKVLEALFFDVDDYVSDPVSRTQVGAIDGDELRARARHAYGQLYGRDQRSLPDISSFMKLIDRFLDGSISAADFSTSFMRELKSEKRLLGDPAYPPLQELFEDCDAYVEYDELRTGPEDLDDERLYSCAIRARNALRNIGYG